MYGFKMGKKDLVELKSTAGISAQSAKPKNGCRCAFCVGYHFALESLEGFNNGG